MNHQQLHEVLDYYVKNWVKYSTKDGLLFNKLILDDFCRIYPFTLPDNWYYFSFTYRGWYFITFK